MEQRLQKLIAHAGITSRRKAEDLIRQGHVTVNGTRAQIGDKADPAVDDIRVRGEELRPTQEFVYYALNKPRGVLCTASDEHGRQNVLSLVPAKPRVFTVGRLDMDTEGLILLTNDGDWANSIMHPKFNIFKTYEVSVDRAITPEDFDRLRTGLEVGGKKITPDSVKKQTAKKIKLIIHEGQKRIVRRLMEKLGYEVIHLKRTQIGKLNLGALKTSEYKTIERKQVIGTS